MPDDIEPAPDASSLELRVPDAGRDRVVTQLQDALASGMIDLDEFHDRSQRALAARTRGELLPVTADLPASAAQALAAPGDVVELRHTFGSLKRSGRWVVPRNLRVSQRMGSAELDFTEAEISDPVISIELDVSGGSVEVRLPDGASASIDGVAVSHGSAEDHRKDAAPGGNPHFAFTGAVRWGSFELRGPRTRLFRRK